MNREICLNAIEIHIVTPQSRGLRECDRDPWQYKYIEYWAGLIDTLPGSADRDIFVTDIVDRHAVCGEDGVGRTARHPVNDPLRPAAPIPVTQKHPAHSPLPLALPCHLGASRDLPPA